MSTPPCVLEGFNPLLNKRCSRAEGYRLRGTPSGFPSPLLCPSTWHRTRAWQLVWAVTAYSVPLADPTGSDRSLGVPHVSWNSIYKNPSKAASDSKEWLTLQSTLEVPGSAGLPCILSLIPPG